MKYTTALLTALLLGAVPTIVKADIKYRVQSSVQLSVDGAASTSSRIGSTYAVTGTNITPTYDSTANAIGGLNTAASGITSGVPAPLDTTFAVTTAGDSFALTETLTTADTIPSATSTTNGVAALPAFGITTTYAGGSAGSIGGAIASDHAITSLAAGNAGSTAIGQVITELTID